MGDVQSGGDVNDYQYSAPELHPLEGYSMGETFIMKESDVYGMGMVVFEASSHRPLSSGARINLALIS